MSFKYRVLNIATSRLKKTISIACKKLAPQISAQLAENAGFILSKKEHTIERKNSEFSTVFNHVYSR